MSTIIHPSQEEFCKLWGQLVARSWEDEAFRARLKADPAGVLAEHGYALPPDAGIELQVDESTDKIQYLYMPCHGELADPSKSENAGALAEECLNNRVVLARLEKK
jgi:hypothetical protein